MEIARAAPSRGRITLKGNIALAQSLVEPCNSDRVTFRQPNIDRDSDISIASAKQSRFAY
jgi:hypothetical protein